MLEMAVRNSLKGCYEDWQAKTGELETAENAASDAQHLLVEDLRDKFQVEQDRRAKLVEHLRGLTSALQKLEQNLLQ
jgi:hypothetical protein